MRTLVLLVVAILFAGTVPAVEASDPSPTPERWGVSGDRDLRSLDEVLAFGRDGRELVLVAARTSTRREALVVLASRDGLEWHVRSRTRMPVSEAGPFVIDGRRIVGFGPGLDQPLLLSDDGGRTWRVGPDARPLMPGIRAQQDCCRWHFPYGGGRALTRTRDGWLLAGGIWPRYGLRTEAAIWTSADGTRWHRAAAPPTSTLSGVATEGRTAVAISEHRGHPTRRLWWRNGAGRWSRSASIGEPAGYLGPHGVVRAPGIGYLAWGYGAFPSIVVDDVISIPSSGSRIQTSPDGRTWTMWPADPALRGRFINSIAVTDGGRVLAVGNDEWEAPMVWRLTSDRTWLAETLPIPDQFQDGEVVVGSIAALAGNAALAGPVCSSGRCRIGVWVEESDGTLTPDANDETKARHAFVFGDFERIHRSALIACVIRASQFRHKSIELAAHRLLLRLNKATG
jgi:hypothetical protein